jgi:type IV secretion system protein VirB4
MMFLREHARHASRLSDFLPWAAMIAPGIILNKDGSFLRIARFRGPDLDSATQAELMATSARLNSALKRLGPCPGAELAPDGVQRNRALVAVGR